MAKLISSGSSARITPLSKAESSARSSGPFGKAGTPSSPLTGAPAPSWAFISGLAFIPYSSVTVLSVLKMSVILAGFAFISFNCSGVNSGSITGGSIWPRDMGSLTGVFNISPKSISSKPPFSAAAFRIAFSYLAGTPPTISLTNAAISTPSGICEKSRDIFPFLVLLSWIAFI